MAATDREYSALDNNGQVRLDILSKKCVIYPSETIHRSMVRHKVSKMIMGLR